MDSGHFLYPAREGYEPEFGAQLVADQVAWLRVQIQLKRFTAWTMESKNAVK